MMQSSPFPSYGVGGVVSGSGSGARSTLSNLRWLVPTMTALKSNEWKSESTVYFNGKGWYDNKLQDEAAIGLFNALAQNQTARSLVIQDAQFDLKAQCALKVAFERNHTLEVVTLRNIGNANQYNNGPSRGGLFLHVPASVFENPNLRELRLEKCALDSHACVALGKLLHSENSCLTTLSLKDVHLHEEAAVTNSFTSSSRGRKPAKKVTAGATWGGCSGHANAHETSVNCSLCSVAIGLSKSVSLKELSLQEMCLSMENVNTLLLAVARNRSIQTLRLEKLSLNVQVAIALVSLLHGNKQLTELSLRHNDLDGDAIHLISALGLQRNTTLQTLLLSHNPIGDDGAHHLVQALSVNKTLRKLCLRQTEIWQEGCKALLLQGLTKNTGLRHISLDENDVEVCLPELLEMLQHNMLLESVLDSLPLLLRQQQQQQSTSTTANKEVQVWKEVDLLLRMNKAGRALLKSKEGVKPCFIPYILANAGSAASNSEGASSSEGKSRPTTTISNPPAPSSPDVLFEMLRQIPF